MIGLVASDGNLSPDGRHIDITSSDYEFLLKIKDLTGITNKIGIKYGSNRKQKAFHIQIGNKNFYEFLLSIGLIPKKSLAIEAVNVPKRFFVDFLRGLIDGDGSMRRWIHPRNLREQWSLRIYSGSSKFLEWLETKTKEYFGAHGRLHRDKRAEHNYILKFGKIAARQILKNCYYKNNFSLQRKNQLAQQCILSYVGWQRSKTVSPGLINAGVLEWQTI